MKCAGRMGEGKPFSMYELLHLGKRATLDQPLSRLVRAGRLTRLLRCMCVLPNVSAVIGKMPPYALRLTTHNQLGRTFPTTGHPRTLKMSGMHPIHLKYVLRKKAIAPLMGSMAGVAAIGLLSLGAKNVDRDVVDIIKKNISAEDFDRLVSAAPRMPSWLADILLPKNRVKSGNRVKQMVIKDFSQSERVFFRLRKA